METITFQVEPGTRSRLRKINRNLSALMRQSVEQLLERKTETASGYTRIAHLAGSLKSGRKDLATTKDYLQIYAKKHR